MSQDAARQGPRARSADEDEAVAPVRPASGGDATRARMRRPSRRPGDDDEVTPDEPGEDEFELIGDDDLGAADLGPAAPDARDPDADSGRIRRMTR